MDTRTIVFLAILLEMIVSISPLNSDVLTHRRIQSSYPKFNGRRPHPPHHFRRRPPPPNYRPNKQHYRPPTTPQPIIKPNSIINQYSPPPVNAFNDQPFNFNQQHFNQHTQLQFNQGQNIHQGQNIGQNNGQHNGINQGQNIGQNIGQNGQGQGPNQGQNQGQNHGQNIGINQGQNNGQNIGQNGQGQGQNQGQTNGQINGQINGQNQVRNGHGHGQNPGQNDQNLGQYGIQNNQNGLNGLDQTYYNNGGYGQPLGLGELPESPSESPKEMKKQRITFTINPNGSSINFQISTPKPYKSDVKNYNPSTYRPPTVNPGYPGSHYNMKKPEIGSLDLLPPPVNYDVKKHVGMNKLHDLNRQQEPVKESIAVEKFSQPDPLYHPDASSELLNATESGGSTSSVGGHSSHTDNVGGHSSHTDSVGGHSSHPDNVGGHNNNVGGHSVGDLKNVGIPTGVPIGVPELGTRPKSDQLLLAALGLSTNPLIGLDSEEKGAPLESSPSPLGLMDYLQSNTEPLFAPPDRKVDFIVKSSMKAGSVDSLGSDSIERYTSMDLRVPQPYSYIQDKLKKDEKLILLEEKLKRQELENKILLEKLNSKKDTSYISEKIKNTDSKEVSGGGSGGSVKYGPSTVSSVEHGLYDQQKGLYEDNPRQHLITPSYGVAFPTNRPIGPQYQHTFNSQIHQGAPQIHQGAPQGHQFNSQGTQGAPQIHQGAPQGHQFNSQGTQGAPQIHQGAPQIHQGAPQGHQFNFQGTQGGSHGQHFNPQGQQGAPQGYQGHQGHQGNPFNSQGSQGGPQGHQGHPFNQHGGPQGPPFNPQGQQGGPQGPQNGLQGQQGGPQGHHNGLQRQQVGPQVVPQSTPHQYPIQQQGQQQGSQILSQQDQGNQYVGQNYQVQTGGLLGRGGLLPTPPTLPRNQDPILGAGSAAISSSFNINNYDENNYQQNYGPISSEIYDRPSHEHFNEGGPGHDPDHHGHLNTDHHGHLNGGPHHGQSNGHLDGGPHHGQSNSDHLNGGPFDHHGHNNGGQNLFNGGFQGVPPTPQPGPNYYIVTEPEPIIEIIVQDSNVTLPAYPTQPPLNYNSGPPTPEPVHVFYVKYSQKNKTVFYDDPYSSYSEPEINLENPIASIPVRGPDRDLNVGQYDQQPDQVHDNSETQSVTVTTTEKSTEPTTLRTVINPMKNEYSASRLAVHFDQPPKEYPFDISQHNQGHQGQGQGHQTQQGQEQGQGIQAQTGQGHQGQGQQGQSQQGQELSRRIGLEDLASLLNDEGNQGEKSGEEKQLPDDVPHDLKQQLINSGILNNAQVQVINFDDNLFKELSSLPPEAISALQSQQQQNQWQSDLKKRSINKIYVVNNNNKIRSKRQPNQAIILLLTDNKAWTIQHNLIKEINHEKLQHIYKF